MILRSKRLIPAAGVAAILLPAIAYAAAADVPLRKGGWWETTLTTPGGASKYHVCSDAAAEAANRATYAEMDKLAGCSVTSVTKTATGWTKMSTCRGENGKVTGTITFTLTGDLNTGYKTETTGTGSFTSGSRTTQKLLGACPAGRKPGQRVTSDGKVGPYPPPIPAWMK
jgi:hypothetical protein